MAKLQDTGKRTKLATGSVRERAKGKGRFDLLSPISLMRLAKHFENGADKYVDRNWELGQPLSFYVDAAFRHIVKLMAGMVDEDHAAAADWNMHCFMHTQEMIRAGKLPAELDDMPTYIDLG